MFQLNRMRAVFVAMVLLLLGTPAWALSLQDAMAGLDQAKEQGLVGEQPDGYLGVVKAQGNAAEIVRLINEARKAEYQRLASKNGISISNVEAIAGKKAIEKTRPGHYIYSNGWVRK